MLTTEEREWLERVQCDTEGWATSQRDIFKLFALVRRLDSELQTALDTVVVLHKEIRRMKGMPDVTS